MTIRPRERSALSWIFVGAYASGAALFVLSRWIRVATAVGEQHSPWEATTRVLHSVSTYVLVAGLGYLVKSHILPGLRGGKRLPSGVGLLGVFAVLGASAIGILYAGEGPIRDLAILAHTIVGLAAPVVIATHVAGSLVRARSGALIRFRTGREAAC